uniref:Putative ribonuclease H-like domain-containing protein n=1 Tax=Tanacetum cinerariifolium TaxID=118510 RepID=A0A6L2LWJ1_TANCI|nr:putative ribonuclease H-like domain-containing protein [Tanacetum cinerariifolium]
MESLCPQVVFVAKLPILNPNEFDLWKIRIEHYFQMTDYSLWEAILNGDSPIPTRVVDDKHQLKFNIYKDVKSLMKAIKKRFGGNKETKKMQKTLLKQQYENFTGSILKKPTHRVDNSHSKLEAQDISGRPNTNESVSAVTSVSPTSTKVPVFALPNVNNLSDAVIYSFFSKEIDLKWQIAMLTKRARRFLQRTRRNPGANGTTSIGFDMSKVECYNCHRRRYFARKYRSPKDTRNKDTQRRNVLVETSTSNALVSQGLESVEARLVIYQQNENMFEEDIKLLKLNVMLRENALVDLRNKFEKAEQERDELKLKLENFQTSSKNLSQLLASQITDKTRLGYDNQVFSSTVFDYDELIILTQMYVVPITLLTRSRHVTLTAARPVTSAVPQAKMQHQRPTKHDVSKAHSPIRMPINLRPSPTNVNFHQQVTIFKVTQVFAVQGVKENWLPDENHVLLRVPRENNMYNVDLKNIVPSGYLTCLFAKATFDESNLWHRRLGHINFKTMNNLVKGIKREFSVAKTPQQNGIAKRKNRTLIEAAKTMLADSLLPTPFWAEAVNTACNVQNMANEGFLVRYSVSSKAFRVFNSRTRIVQETLHINFLEIQPNVAGSRPTWLFDIDTLTQSMNYQPVVVGNQPNSSVGIHENFTVDAAAFEVKKPESAVHVSLRSCDKTKKHDDKTKREAKDKCLVELSTRFRDLSDDFEEFSDNSTNKVNAASTPVTAVELNSTNNTNTFSAAGPSNNAVSSNFELGGKYSYVDPFQYPDALDILALEDITYSDDEKDVGVEADFSNLETNINEECIYYEEVFSPVARIEAIRLFLAYASFMRFMVYQMDVKSAFLYGTIKEEVYVCQPSGFKDLDYPDKVYKVVKALYGLHQAPRAWFETLANYLLENGFQKGKIDQTLFIKKQKGNILLIQVYVDNIIFRSTNKDLCIAFEKLMKDKFQMSLIGELTSFLGLQVKQKQDGIFISQDKYVAKILRMFGLTYRKSASTPIDIEKPLLKDPEGEDVDVRTYRSMIGSLMYLTLSRPKIMFAVCECACFQGIPKASHLHAVKRIFSYLKGKPYLGLWYPKDLPFNLVAYSDSDYAGASLDRKSTTRGCQFLGQMATGKENSDSFMADSLPESILLTFIHGICIDMVLLNSHLSI